VDGNSQGGETVIVVIKLLPIFCLPLPPTEKPDGVREGSLLALPGPGCWRTEQNVEAEHAGLLEVSCSGDFLVYLLMSLLSFTSPS
jgi:hypothetical protein